MFSSRMDVQIVIFPGVVEEKRSLYWLSFLAPLWCVTRWQPNPMSVATYSHYLLSIFKACIFFGWAVGCWTWRLDIDGTILGERIYAIPYIYICIYLQIHRHIRHIYIYIYIWVRCFCFVRYTISVSAWSGVTLLSATGGVVAGAMEEDVRRKFRN